MAEKRTLGKSPTVLIGVPILVALIGAAATLLAVYLPKKDVPVVATTEVTTVEETQSTEEATDIESPSAIFNMTIPLTQPMI